QGFKTRKNLITALACYVRAYRLGSPKAAEVLVTLLDDASIYDSLQLGIRKSNPEAMFVRAAMSALGFDYRLTQNQAMDLLLKAVEKKYPAAAIEAGLCYYTGTLVKKDKAKAHEFWKRAAQFGDREGLIRIAFTTILEDSNQTHSHRDDIQTLHLAAEQGSVLAQASLAYCYRNGIGIVQNKGRAAGLYWSAAQRGNDAAYQSLKSMIDEIRPADPEFLMPE
ncbi:MAG: sel1 repeat family protein, partial [Candidatus Delongbacteria bacterium]|nr:sel1 repeat family protein [Candidatus Delongbacteria bacterium]